MSTPVEEKKEEVSQAEYTYAILQETSGEECESWLYFIRYQGNEDALKYLQAQLESIDWYILDDLSTFDLELNYLVKESTAKDMTKVELNHHSHHRKFDGKLDMIDMGLKHHYKNEKKMIKVFDILGYGQIEEYIEGEDIDPEDLCTDETEHEHESSDEKKDSNSGEEETESDSDTESEESESGDEKRKKKCSIPRVLMHDIPRVAMAKQARNLKNKRNK